MPPPNSMIVLIPNETEVFKQPTQFTGLNNCSNNRFLVSDPSSACSSAVKLETTPMVLGAKLAPSKVSLNANAAVFIKSV